MIIPRRSNRIVKRWTKAAIECYKIGCNCSKCYMKNILENKCEMKYSVIELIKKIGAPQNIRNDIIED